VLKQRRASKKISHWYVAIVKGPYWWLAVLVVLLSAYGNGKIWYCVLRPAEFVMELVLVGEDTEMTRWGWSEVMEDATQGKVSPETGEVVALVVKVWWPMSSRGRWLRLRWPGVWWRECRGYGGSLLERSKTSKGQRSPRVERTIAWWACLVQERPVRRGGCSSVWAVVEVRQPLFCRKWS
jgi:hypothetical protein